MSVLVTLLLESNYLHIISKRPVAFNMVLTSAWAITGNVLAYNKNNTKKNPIVPMKIPISTKVGENMVHEEGR